jgi:hypothetical protein
MKFSPILFALIILSSRMDAASFTNSVSVDSFVRAAAPASNYGGAGALSVSGASAMNGSGFTNGVFDSFVRFNTAAMVASFNSAFGTNNRVISAAALRVTELGSPANNLFNRGVGAFEIRWIQTTLGSKARDPNAPTTTGSVYNDEPNLLQIPARLGTFTNSGVDGALDFPLSLPSELVTDLKSRVEVGLYLTAIDSGIGFNFDSRSVGTLSARPFLLVSAAPQPAITRIEFHGGNIAITATNGFAGATCYLLTSSNITLPQWTPVATNSLVTNGEFAFNDHQCAKRLAPLFHSSNAVKLCPTHDLLTPKERHLCSTTLAIFFPFNSVGVTYLWRVATLVRAVVT